MPLFATNKKPHYFKWLCLQIFNKWCNLPNLTNHATFFFSHTHTYATYFATSSLRLGKKPNSQPHLFTTTNLSPKSVTPYDPKTVQSDGQFPAAFFLFLLLKRLQTFTPSPEEAKITNKIIKQCATNRNSSLSVRFWALSLIVFFVLPFTSQPDTHQDFRWFSPSFEPSFSHLPSLFNWVHFQIYLQIIGEK